MTKDEFIKICSQCGYAPKSVASKYAESKGELTENDLQEVWRINERRLDFKNNVDYGRYRVYQGVRTTKRLKYGERKGE